MSNNMFEMLANTDLSQVDTSYPNIAVGTYEWRVKSAEKKTSERTGGEYLLFQCELLTDTAVDTNGSSLNPGYSLRHMINLTPSEKQLQKDGLEGCQKKIMADLCKFLDAIMTERQWDETLESYVGLTFFAQTKVSKERTDERTGDTYPPQAEFAKFLPKQ